MYTLAAILGVVILASVGYKLYENWKSVNSVPDLETIFKNYNSVDDLKVAYDNMKAEVDAFKEGIAAQIKTAEDKVTALKTLLD